jgi:hypothetical protein
MREGVFVMRGSECCLVGVSVFGREVRSSNE